MNRIKREELRKAQARQMALDNLSEKERHENLRKELKQQVREDISELLRQQLFPEEGDFYNDESSDIHARKQGRFPFNEDYINKFQNKRLSLGVEPLEPSGHEPSGSSARFCDEIIHKILSDEKLEKVFNAVQKIGQIYV